MLEGVKYQIGPTILLRSGGYFDFDAPEASTFTIEDIAHALSNLCRFTGHTREFYSVAEHSLWCSVIVPRRWALHALLHDAAEAFVGDMSRPLKVMLPGYREIEKRVEAVVLARFGLSPDMPPEVKQADLRMLRTEQHWGMESDEPWPGIENMPFGVMPEFWSPKVARKRFLDRFEELAVVTGGGNG